MANYPRNTRDNEERERDHKKVLLLLLLLLLLLFVGTVIAFGVTYARYKNEPVTSEPELTVAKWGVVTTLDADAHLVPNQYVADGVIAPASEAYIDVTIQLNGTQVAVDYVVTIGDISLQTGSHTTADDIEVITVEKIVPLGVDDAEGTALTAEADGTFIGTIDLPNKATDATKKDSFGDSDTFKIRIYFQWENDETNNDNDTQLGKDAPTLVVEIKVDAQQHIKPADDTSNS